MGRFALERVAGAFPVILGTVVVVFLLTRIIPGDPIIALIGEVPAPPDYVTEVRRDFGLDEPLHIQLWLYLVNLAQGNFGFSFVNRQPVLSLVLERAQLTLLIMIPALTLASAIGVLLGLVAARKPGSAYDTLATATSLIGYSMPVFWLAQVLIVLFAVQLAWLPAQGMRDVRQSLPPLEAAGDVLRHIVLPVFSIAVFYMAVVARVARASLADALQEEFIRTARAKGLGARSVIWRHALPNALIPIVTVIGYNFGLGLTGAMLAETVFAWPGIGSLFLSSLSNRDYPVLQAIIFFSAAMVVIANVTVDVLYAALDPRIRLIRS